MTSEERADRAYRLVAAEIGDDDTVRSIIATTIYDVEAATKERCARLAEAKAERFPDFPQVVCVLLALAENIRGDR